MIAKKHRRGEMPLVFKKVTLSSVLFLLFSSRIISCFGTAASVEATYSAPVDAGSITVPQVENQEEIAVLHINEQTEAVTKTQNSAPIEKLYEDQAKADRIRAFYAQWNAPMAAQADYIVEVANLFGIDWRLLPAISVVESSGGNYCFRNYNPFGWGKMNFASFEDAIYTVGEGIANGYRTSNPYLMAPTYNPVTPESWGSKVDMLMKSI